VKRADRLHTPAWLACAGAVLVLLNPAGAIAQDRGDLHRLEGEIKTQQGRQAELARKSQSLAAELADLRQKAIGAARATQDSESLLTRLEHKLRKAKEDLHRQEKSLAKRRKEIGGTLLALERLSRNPPRALLLSPSKPMEVVHQAMLLRTSLPIIQNRAEELRENVLELARTRDDIDQQLKELKHASALYTSQRKMLDSLISRKAGLLHETDAERKQITKRLKRLTRQAATLKELFDRLEAERPPPPPAAPAQSEHAGKPAKKPQTAALSLPRPNSLRRFPDHGSITLPVRGELSQHFGEATPYGGTAKGITIKTRPAARVVAPYDGKVVFAGPFRGYGQILIIEHAGGYHSLLSGMERVDTGVGQWLLAGEPVGVMAKAGNGNPRLYFELRRDGQPINPLPWFAEYRGKDRG
jgi:septal ring factor EnvC (AmiA/AmiB activator)